MEYGKDFNREVSINKFKLEDECERHPGLYAYYAEEYAKICHEVDSASGVIEFLIAEEELKIRRNPPEDIPKVTDKAIASLISSNVDIGIYKNKLLDLKKKQYTLKGALTALEHRRSELNNLVSLYQSSYFSKPSGYKKENNTDAAQREQRQNIKRRNKDE